MATNGGDRSLAQRISDLRTRIERAGKQAKAKERARARSERKGARARKRAEKQRRIAQNNPETVTEAAQATAREAKETARATREAASSTSSAAKSLVTSELGIERAGDADPIIGQLQDVTEEFGSALDVDDDGDTDLFAIAEPASPPGADAAEPVLDVGMGNSGGGAIDPVDADGNTSVDPAEPVMDPFEGDGL